jgi:hypothetical protein
MGKMRDVYRVLVEKLEGKRPLGRPRRRWEDNIKMNLQEVGYGGWLRIGTGGGHLVAGTCEYSDEHSGDINCVEFLD